MRYGGRNPPAVFYMNIHLSPRLQAVANAVPFGARLIDVGTDHGKLPVWLAQSGKITHAWASDVRPGPLQSAQNLVAETELESCIELRLTDGLKGFSPEDGDTVTIAGMGGETMVSILSAAPWTKENILLVLEPQSKQHLLRKWLLQSGYTILSEALVQDAGRIYPIMTVRGGQDLLHTEAELHTGRYEAISPDPLFSMYLESVIARISAAAPYDAGAHMLLKELNTMKERLTNDHD